MFVLSDSVIQIYILGFKRIHWKYKLNFVILMPQKYRICKLTSLL